MKRNFLLMLLLTLLPFAGWAQGLIVPVEVGTAADFEAVFTAAGGGAIKLTGDIDLEQRVLINDGKSYTIDLNGKKITSKSNVFLVVNGSLDLTGEGTVECVGAEGVPAVNPSTGDCAVIMGGYDPDGTGFTEGWTSSLTVGEKVTLIGGYSGIVIQPAKPSQGWRAADGVELTINGIVYPYGGNDGTNANTTNILEGISAVTIHGYVQGTSKNAPKITIGSTAKLTADNGPAIYAAGYANWTIENGAEISSATFSAVEARGGKFVINGGTFTNTLVDETDPFGAQESNSGASSWGAAFAVNQYGTGLPIDVLINDGEFKGAAALYVANPNNTAYDKVTVSVKGGSFDGVVSADVNSNVFDKKILKGGLYSKSPDDNYVAKGYSVFAFDDPTYKFAIYGEGEYDWAMSKKEGFYQASAWDPTITVFTPNNVLIPEFKDISGQTTRRNWIARYFRGLNDDDSVDEDTEVDGMRHVGEYWVQPYLVSYSETDGEMEIGAAIGEPKKFIVKQAELKLRLSLIYPYFHQKDIYAEWTTEGYKKVSTEPNSFDNENNTKVVNITYVQDPTSNGLEGKPLSERTDEWWNDPEFDWEAAGKLKANEIEKFTLANNLYNYSASGNLLRAYVIDNGMIYEDYNVKMQVPGYAELQKNNAIIELNADEDLETINKVYGDKDPEGPYATVTDQDDADMSGEEYGADINITISREKEGKYEDAGTYDVYVDITGGDFVNYNFTGGFDEIVDIEGGKRYIFKDAFTIEQYDITEAEIDDPEDSKVVISINDVTYDGTYQQVKPQIVKFLDVNNVLAPVEGNPVTSNEYVPQLAAIPDDPETPDVDESAPAQFGYVILTEDKPAVAAVEDNPETTDVDESVPAQDAVKGDWRLAYLRTDGKGSQKGVDSNTDYTYYYNRWVSRQTDGTVNKNVGECNIMVATDNGETEENEGSINFCGKKTGNFTVNPRDLHVRVAASKATFGTSVGDILASCTLEEVETAATDDGFVVDEKSGVKDNFPVTETKVALVYPNVVFNMPLGYTGNVDKYTITASLKEGVNRKNVALNYNVIFDEFANNFEVTPLSIALVAIDQTKSYPAPVDGVYAEPVATKGEKTGTFEVVATDVNTTTIAVKDADNNDVTLPDGVQLSDLVTLTCDVTKIGTTEGALKLHEIKTRTGAAANVQFTTKDGNLTITPLNEIRLAYDNVEQALQDHKGYGAGEGESMKVYLPSRRLKTNTWYSMVLPFRFYVPTFSNKLNYASVALLEETTSGNDVHFNTNVGWVEANTPFLFKVAPGETNFEDETTWSAENLADVGFENVKIGDNFDYNGEEDPFVETHEGGVKFIGSYKTLEYLAVAKSYIAKKGMEPNEWFVSTANGKFYRGNESNKNHNILTTEAYLSFPEGVYEARIFIDDEEGNATAIYGIDAEPAEIAASKNAEGIYNLAGQRVSKAQKGIFIKNGKKVLVK